MNEKELKIKITTSNAQETINQVKEIEKQLKQLGETVKSVRKNADGSLTIRSAKESAGKIANITRKYNKEGTQLYTTQRINDLKKSTKTLGSVLHTVGTKTIATFTAAIGVVKGFYNGMEKLTTASINYSEALNLFNVVFKNIEKNGETTYSKLGKQAIQFQNKLKYNFGANMEESLTYQGLFQSMAESQGISDEAAYIMSENSTKLVYDLSSLFNKEQEDVAEALRAGIYAGQTKPLRTYGLDITENSLQVTLDKLKETNSAIGDLKVSTMSQAEKQILRYITVLDQASVAHGDFANTLNSPANQLKMLENQLKMTATSIGNLFVKPFNNILIFTNAILMVIENLANAIAKAFEIDVSDYNTSIGTYGDAFGDAEENIDGATDALKKLKRQTLGFDQINNITTDTSNNKDGSGLGNINSALLDSLTGYDNKMVDVSNKAREISEKIMEWLGFTKLVDELTGEVSYKFDHLTIGTVLGMVATGGVVVTGVTKIYKTFKKVKDLLGKTNAKNLADGVEKTNSNLATTLNNMTAIQKLLIGGTGLVVGLGLVSDSAKKLAEDADNLGARFENALGFLTTSSGGALIGSSLQKFGDKAGVIGTTIGGVIGIVTSAYADYKTTVDNVIKLSDTLKYNNEKLAESYKPVLEQLRSSDWKIAYYDSLLAELDTIVDKNGKIKKGYEDRAKFISDELKKAYGVEIEITDDVIQNYDKQIDKIKDTIELQQAQLQLEIFQEAYKNAYNNKTKVLNNYLKAKEKYYNRSSYLSDEETIELYNAYKEAEKIYKNNEFVLDNYSNYAQAVAEEDVAAAKRYGLELSTAITENAEGVNIYLSNIVNEAYDKEKELLKKYKTTYGEASDEVKREILGLYDDTIDVLTNMVTDLEPGGKLSKEQVIAWKRLAATNVDAYNEAIKKLTPEQRKILQNSMQTTYDKVKEIFKNPIVAKIQSKLEGTAIGQTIKNITGDVAKTIDDAFGKGTTTKISDGLKKVASIFGVKGYATGGFPEDGLFFANHGELVGKFSNGKTAVANNEQITEGIRRAVMTGMTQALATSGGSNVVIDVRADEGIIVQKAINGINRITDATGESPLHI